MGRFRERLDERVLHDLVELLSGADSPDTLVQRRIAEGLASFEKLPNSPWYCLCVFRELTDQPETVRERAGLLLKSRALCYIDNTSPGEREESSAWKELKCSVLEQLADPSSSSLRRAAGIVLAAIAAKEGISQFVELLPGLLNLLNQQTDNVVVQSAFTVIQHVIEDDMEKELAGGVGFKALYAVPLADRLLQLSGIYQEESLECLNLLARMRLFDHGEPLNHRFGDYWHALYNAGINGCKAAFDGFNYIALNSVQVILDAGLPWLDMVISTLEPSSNNYDIRLSTIELLTTITRSEPLRDLIGSRLDYLYPPLLANARFSRADYEQMGVGLLRDDDAGEVDQETEIAPDFYRDEDDDATVTWGEAWTVRKGAALLIDTLAALFPAPSATMILPLVERRLSSDDWEERESAVLVLGAIARSCGFEFSSDCLRRVFELLLRFCDDGRPALRSISLWALSRYGRAVAANPVVLSTFAKTIVSHLQDRNKSCQQAAVSALAILVEDAGPALAFATDDIIRVFGRCLETYQAKSQRVLYDAIGTFANAFPDVAAGPLFRSQLFEPMLRKWASAPMTDFTLVALFEAITSVAVSLGPGFRPYTVPVIRQSLEIARKALEVIDGDCQSFKDILACSLDLISALEESLPGSIRGALEEERLLTQVLVAVTQANQTTVGAPVKAAAFALIGDLAEQMPNVLKPNLTIWVEGMLPYIYHGNMPVANNASWGLGQLILHCADGQLIPYLDRSCQQLCRVLTSTFVSIALSRNAAMTLARIALVYPHHVKSHLLPNLGIWCDRMSSAPCDEEKLTAFKGLAKLLEIDPTPISDMNVLPPMIEASCSLISYILHDQPPRHPLHAQLYPAATELVKWIRMKCEESQWNMAIEQLSPTSKRILVALMSEF